MKATSNMKACYQEQNNRVAGSISPCTLYLIGEHVPCPIVISGHLPTTATATATAATGTTTGALALNKKAELLLYQQQNDTTITAATGNAAAAANNSTTPIVVATANSWNTPTRKEDDSESMLLNLVWDYFH